MDAPLRPSRRSIATALLCISIIVGGLLGTTPAGAQGDTSTTAIESDGESPVGNIVPRPNSGQAPDSPNDPGGWQQYLVFGVMFAGLGLIVALVVRESRRAKARTST